MFIEQYPLFLIERLEKFLQGKRLKDLPMNVFLTIMYNDKTNRYQKNHVKTEKTPPGDNDSIINVYKYCHSSCSFDVLTSKTGEVCLIK